MLVSNSDAAEVVGFPSTSLRVNFPSPLLTRSACTELAEVRESWDNFRTAPWIDIIDYPELTLKENQEILAFQGGQMYA